MTWMAGESLLELIQRSPDGVAEADLRAALADVLDALDVTHGEGRVHRNIRPWTIVMGPDGHAVLAEGGSGDDAAYLPMEQVQGVRQGAYSDLYSLGAVALEAIGGRVVRAERRQAALAYGRQDPQTPAAEIGAGRYAPHLLETIDRALVVGAGGRLARAVDMRMMLDTGIAAPAAPEPIVTKVPRTPLPIPAELIALSPSAPVSDEPAPPEPILPEPVTAEPHPASPSTEPEQEPDWVHALKSTGVAWQKEDETPLPRIGTIQQPLDTQIRVSITQPPARRFGRTAALVAAVLGIIGVGGYVGRSELAGLLTPKPAPVSPAAPIANPIVPSPVIQAAPAIPQPPVVTAPPPAALPPPPAVPAAPAPAVIPPATSAPPFVPAMVAPVPNVQAPEPVAPPVGPPLSDVDVCRASMDAKLTRWEGDTAEAQRRGLTLSSCRAKIAAAAGRTPIPNRPAGRQPVP